MGIALANFPEFGLWTFLSSSEQKAMPTASVDEIVRFLQYLLVDGKFYTILLVAFRHRLLVDISSSRAQAFCP